MRKVRILVASTDRAVRQTVVRLLDQDLRADIQEFTTGPDAFQEALASLPDLLILASELPGYDGLQVCHRLRNIPQFRDTPIVIMGPRGDQPRKYQAYYVGATDFVELPFDGVEFMFRLRVHLRTLLRQLEATAAPSNGLLHFDPERRSVAREGREVTLTPSEYALLALLATHPGQPMSVERLLTEGLARPAQLGNPQLIHTHMKNLRRKLEDDPQNPRLLIRHPAGYLLSD